MTQLTPIELEDGTVIYVEATEDVNAVPIDTSEERGRVRKGGNAQTIKSFEAIKGTITAYTNYTLNAFKEIANANVDKVPLEFGIKIGGETGIPYVTKGTAESNLKITVECSFPKKPENENT
ncbi:CU044_2847 family protein [Microseira wollei]|uniref:Trypsin-co-occurring domain-containing protein n=1 Tax=Microseira wollei NIES-4236 TaxID=2530354 RepID=A0AAV3XJR0_9CYAN|nr:CU044_2847 family protein [Microseira wollei]GET41841.1 hypothetical protein MiSe_66550 [Microseira wollei NIES-4236]